MTHLEELCLLNFMTHPAALAARWRSQCQRFFIIPYLQEFVKRFFKNFLKKFSSQNLTPLGEHLFALHSLYISVSLVDLLKCQVSVKRTFVCVNNWITFPPFCQVFLWNFCKIIFALLLYKLLIIWYNCIKKWRKGD